MIPDLDEIRKPLSMFAKQSESQRYIKNIRILCDAWRRISDEPVADCDKVILETNFGLTVNFTSAGVEMSVNPVTEYQIYSRQRANSLHPSHRKT